MAQYAQLGMDTAKRATYADLDTTASRSSAGSGSTRGESNHFIGEKKGEHPWPSSYPLEAFLLSSRARR